MFTLQNILAEPALGLTRMGSCLADPEISWAHVSELPDPSPWLAGDELLLTTGLELFYSDGQAETYLAHLANRGVGALGISTGPSLPHSEVPPGLIAAANAIEFPLLLVPEQVPLQAVVRFVSEALNHAETEPLRRALLAQRKLTEAVLQPDGLAAVITTLTDSTGISAAVYDLSFHELGSSGLLAAGEFAQNEGAIRKLVLRGGTWSFAAGTAEVSTLATPLGIAGSARGVLITAKNGPITFFDRSLISMMTSLLGMLIELRHSGDAQKRTVSSAVVRSLIEGGVTDVEAALQIASIGVQCESVQVLVMPVRTRESVLDAIAEQLRECCVASLVSRTDDHAIILLCGPNADAERAARDTVSLAAAGPAGLGMSVATSRADLSFAQAVRAQKLARAKREPIRVLSASQGYRALLALGDEIERSSFADAVLSPIDAHDARYGTELTATLRTFFRHSLNLESAARDLGIHRHTMRSRLDRIHALTGRRLNDPDDILELWLACESRLLRTGE